MTPHAGIIADLQALLGDAARLQGRYDDAERLLRTSITGFESLSPRARKSFASNRARAHLYLARALFALGRHEVARLLRRAAEAYPTQSRFITGMPVFLGQVLGMRASGEFQDVRRRWWARAAEGMLMGDGKLRRLFDSRDQVIDLAFLHLENQLREYRSFFSEIGVMYCRLAHSAVDRGSHAGALDMYLAALRTLGRFTHGWRLASWITAGQAFRIRLVVRFGSRPGEARDALVRGFSVELVKNLLAWMLLNERHFETAEEALRIALEVSAERGDDEDFATLLYLLGNVQREQGRSEEAVETYLQVTAECSRIATPTAARLALLSRVGIVEVCLRKERYTDLEMACGEILLHARGVDDEERLARALAHRGVGEARARRGLFREAETAYRAALQNLGEKTPTFLPMDGIGFADASVARLHAGLAEVLHRQGRGEEAEALYRKALVLLVQANHQFLTWDFARVQLGLGAVLHAEGRSEEALAAWTEALDLVERHRAGLRSPSARKELADRFAADYRRVVALCLELGCPLDAWHWAERGKARRLLDRLEGARPRLTPAQARLYEAWVEAERAFVASPDSARAETEHHLRRQLLLEVGSELVQVDVPPSEEMAMHLAALAEGRRVLFLQFVPLPPPEDGEPECDPYVVFALPLLDVHPGAPIPLEPMLLRAEAGAVARCVRGLEYAAVSVKERMIGAAEAALNRVVGEVGRVLVRPVLDELAKRGIDALRMDALLLVPGGELHALPLHAALLEDGEPLLAKVPISLLGSAGAARVLASRLARQRHGEALEPRPDVRLAIGPASAELKGALQETEAVVDEWRRQGALAHRYALGEATVEALVQHAGTVHILHLAGHFTFDEHDPLRSGIDFHEGQLTLGRLISDPSLDLERMRLCYLSGCNSGLSAGRSSEDLEGLVWAFIYAGAWAVHASLWPVEDSVSRDYARVFYQRLREGESIARAAQQAALAVRGTEHDEADAPVSALYWAPFALYDNGLQSV